MSDWLDAETHADRALEMYERGRWAEAESELRKALALNPGQAEWHYNLGLTLEASGRDPEAMASYERAIELIPAEVEPYLAAGIVASRLRQPERAKGYLEQVLSRDPKVEAAYAHKIDCHVRLGEFEEAETTFYLAQQALDEPSAACLAAVAEGLIECGAFERAGWCLREALRLDPGIPRLRARLGAVYAATSRPQRALQMYLRDLRDDPGNIDTLLDYGELLVDLGRLPEASEKFRRVLELEPANLDAHYQLGQIAMAARRYEQAHLEFELVLKLDPEYGPVRLALAEALARRGRRGDARHYLREELDRLRAMEDAATPRGNLARFGALLLEVDLPHEAEDLIRRALERDGEQLELLRKLALARYRCGDRDGGAAVSRRILRQDPGCLVSMHNLALAALEQGRLAVAAGWVRRGLKLDRHDDGLRRLRIRVWLAWIGSWPRRLLGLRRRDDGQRAAT